MPITDIKVIKSFIRVCNDGYLLGYHERNGGNLSYRMKDEEINQCKAYFNKQNSDWIKIGTKAENLKNEFFIVTGSGKYMRNVILEPENNICIVEINDKGDSYRIVWGLESGGRPTSEFPTHFMNHSVRKEMSDGQNRVIYHAHTPNIIALTYILPLDDKSFTRVLWQSATECPVVFPEGVGVVKWMVPGGAEIALATCKLFKKYRAAVWAHHGLFCSGNDFDECFGLMHTIEKSAQIYMLVLSSGQKITATISDENLLSIAKDFNVTLNKEFLELDK